MTLYFNNSLVVGGSSGGGSIDESRIIVKSDTIPEASEELEGYIYQYAGATDETYTHGYIYECKAGLTPDSYVWERINVQPENQPTPQNLVDIYPVIETYQNGNSWYRIYSDGWCEQGGSLSVNGTVSVVYLQPFASSAYSLIITVNTNDNTGNYVTINGSGWISKTSTGFSTYCSATSYKEWFACGYIEVV